MKKIFFILFILISSCFNIFADDNNFKFLDLIPIFPDRDNLKELSKEYNLTLEKYENNEFQFSCDSLKNKFYEITDIFYYYSDERKTSMFITCTKASALALLKPLISIEHNRLVNLDYYYDEDENENCISFIFYNTNKNLYTSLDISNYDYNLTDEIEIYISFCVENNEKTQ